MTDVFRKGEWTPLDQLTKDQIFKIKDKADELLDAITAFPLTGEGLRYQSIAKTNLEQAIMWAVKAITN